MLTFRKAVPADLPGMMTLVKQAQAFMAALGIDQWQDGYPEESLLAEDIRLGRIYVYDDDGAIASIAVMTDEPEPIYDELDGCWLTDGRYLTIHRMALDDAHRHGGLAGKIIDHAVEMARSLHLGSIRADTHRGNKAMRRFLEKNGFVECGLVTYDVTAGDPIRVAYERLL